MSLDDFGDEEEIYIAVWIFNFIISGIFLTVFIYFGIDAQKNKIRGIRRKSDIQCFKMYHLKKRQQCYEIILRLLLKNFLIFQKYFGKQTP